MILYSILMDGVICCKKEFEGQHPLIKVDNLKVWMLTRTLKSRGCLEETYNWQHYYFTLNQNGVQYIKQVLGINEAKVQPKTRLARAEEEEPKAEEREGHAPRKANDHRYGDRTEKAGFRGRADHHPRGGRTFQQERPAAAPERDNV